MSELQPARRGHEPTLVQHWKPILGVGVFISGLPFALFCFALLTVTAGLGAVINATAPMFGALVAWAWLSERPRGLRVLGLVVGFAGWCCSLATRSDLVRARKATLPGGACLRVWRAA